MKLLNALPAKKKREIIIWLSVSSFFLFLLITFFITTIFFKRRELFAIQQSYFKLNYEVGDFAFKQKEKNSLELQNKDLEKKFNNLQNYSKNGAKLAFAFLVGISQVIPKQLYLTEFNFDYKKKDLSLIGFCEDIFLLTEFMDKLAELDVSKHIKLRRLTSSELKEYPLQFSISVQLKEL